jgi:hypothetical protein
MEEKDSNESNEESRARGVKLSSETKIAEVSTGKNKRAKKPTTEATEPKIAQNLFELPFEKPKHTRCVRALETPPVMWPKVK